MIRRTAQGIAMAVCGSMIVVAVPAEAEAAERFKVRGTQTEPVMDGRSVPVTAPPKSGTAGTELKKAPESAWPEGGTAQVEIPGAGGSLLRRSAAPTPQAVGGLPLTLAPAGSTAAGSAGPKGAARSAAAPAVDQRFEVSVKDRKATGKAGVRGLLIGVTPAGGPKVAAPSLAAAADATAPERISVGLDYSAFRNAFGADWASRLRLVQLPGCALTTPDKAECRVPTPLEGVTNDVPNNKLSAEVRLAAGAPVALAAEAGASGDKGDFKATPLAPSGNWQAGGASGDFNWTYPVEVPAGPGDLAPDLSLNYSAQSVDGRTAASNNQPSQVGDGWEMMTGGFVERRYQQCSEVPGSGVGPKDSKGDLCKASENAILSLNGNNTELVRDDATGIWKPAKDDGSKVELLTGAANGDTEGKHWKLTTVDGTQFFFGRNRLPGWTEGKATTESAFTVPLYGKDGGKQHAWRWQLDHVVDTHGNAMAYFYTKETNRYGANGKTAGVEYTRSGHLNRIEYGHRADSIYTAKAPGKVLFDVAERCLPGADCSDALFLPANAKNWPDVPVDQYCAPGKECKNQFAPSFWTRKRISAVSTQVLTAGAYKDVDRWDLEHSFPTTGDGTSPGLWLESIQRTGKAGGSVVLPKVTFSGQQLENRVDGFEGLAPFIRYRINAINTESGGRIGVTYSPRECSVAAGGNVLPGADDSNGMRCFPVLWAAPGQPIGPDGRPKPLKDWFHKYVTTEVLENDLVGGSPTMVSRYEYVGKPAWRYDNSEFARDSERTWNQWRGYEKVRTRTGDGLDKKSLTESVFLRGMDGDKLAAGGTRRSAVADSEGNTVTDHNELAGTTREILSYNGDGGALLSTRSYESWRKGPTASRARTGTDALTSYMFNNAVEHSRTALADGSWRRTKTQTSYDDHGLVTQVEDHGDLADDGDQTCTRTEYARNTATHFVDAVSREETVSVGCGATVQRPQHVLSDDRSYYDGKAFGEAPTKGDVTKAEELGEYKDGAPRYVVAGTEAFDVYGRSVETTDVLGAKSTMVYTPATGEAANKVVETNALGHTETELIDPARGLTLTEIDADGRRTESEYDALGRVTRSWGAGRTRTDPADTMFEYVIRNDGPTLVTTKSRQDDGKYTVLHEFYDGLLRERQTQATRSDLNETTAARTGRVVTEQHYDSLGQVAKESGPYLEKANPSTSLVAVPDTQVIRQQRFEYDGAGRKTADVLASLGKEQWRTTTSYEGDRQHVVPPKGEAPSTTITDVEGRLVELRQYQGEQPAGSYDTTRYTYTPRGDLESVTNPVGQRWSFEYDLRGRKVKETDPSRGPTTHTYDDGDQATSSTDARGQTMSFAYDKLGRRTATYAGAVADGGKTAEWTYDTLSKGELTQSTRIADGKSFTTAVTGYDEGGRPKGNRITVPASEGKLAGTYEFTTEYTSTGATASVQLPAAGGLPSEKLAYGYNAAGLQSTLKGAEQYVSSAKHTPFGELQQYLQGAAGQRLVHTKSYDDVTRRTHKTFVDREVGASTLSEIGYAYDPIGNVTMIDELREGQVRDTQCFAYDHLRRMRDAWTAKQDCGAGPSAESVGGVEAYWDSYTYDKIGNRAGQTRHAVDKAGADEKRTYSYLPGKERGTQANTLSKVETTGPGGTSSDEFGYDATGNTVLRKVGGREQQLTWDAEGNLTKVTEAGRTTEFVYDVTGQRMLRKTADGTTLYLGDTELTLTKGGTEVTGTRHYTHGDTQVASRTGDGKVAYFASDHHETTTLSVTADGAMNSARRSFRPFGESRGGAAGNWPNEKGFVGGTVDESTGLTQLGVRSYDPAAGRFLSVDPVADFQDPQQLNGYAYANNNPVSISDPDGQLIPLLAGMAARMIAQRIAQEIARRIAIEAAKRAAAEAAKRAAIEAAKKAAAEAAKKAAAEAAKKAAAEAAKKAAQEAAKKAAAEAAKKEAAKKAAAEAAKKQAAKKAAQQPAKKQAPKANTAAKKNPPAKSTAQSSKPSAPKPAAKSGQSAKSGSGSSGSGNAGRTVQEGQPEKITGYTKHGLNQSIQRNDGRGVNISKMVDAVRDPKSVTRAEDARGVSWKFVGKGNKKATVVLDAAGKVITAFGKSRGMNPGKRSARPKDMH
ncbi:RHS repeat-associated core domain-containing protein [Streptomyces sp. NPDC058401]|uniref:RHS repeat-associated core domain-containing protein n=1 Tax=Streptomyces sp. NPDC058401 TaxID=3346480 RepID=UPI00365A0497